MDLPLPMRCAPEFGVGDELERCYTPDALAEAVVAAVLPHPVWHYPRVVEPSVGGGAFVRSIRKRMHSAHVMGVDLDPEALGLEPCHNAVGGLSWCSSELDGPGFRDVFCWSEVDLVIGNPPFAAAADHVLTARRRCPAAVIAFILPLANLGVQKWQVLFRAHPVAVVHTIVGRPWPKLVRETAVFEWRPEHQGPTQLRRLEGWP